MIIVHLVFINDPLRYTKTRLNCIQNSHRPDNLFFILITLLCSKIDRKTGIEKGERFGERKKEREGVLKRTSSLTLVNIMGNDMLQGGKTCNTEIL